MQKIDAKTAAHNVATAFIRQYAKTLTSSPLLTLTALISTILLTLRLKYMPMYMILFLSISWLKIMRLMKNLRTNL